MALSKQALQKKREKKKKKRALTSSRTFASPSVSYSHWPLYECWVPKGIWETGIGDVVIARKNSQGDIAMGVYLVDTFCLGVKNCLIHLGNKDDYQIFIRKSCRASDDQLERVTPNYATTLIHKSVEYANQIGFKPHHDYLKAKKLLNNIPIDEHQQFEFGHNGKPLYVQGPHETPADVRRIMKTLEMNKGTGKYDFVLATSDMSEFLIGD